MKLEARSFQDEWWLRQDPVRRTVCDEFTETRRITLYWIWPLWETTCTATSDWKSPPLYYNLIYGSLSFVSPVCERSQGAIKRVAIKTRNVREFLKCKLSAFVAWLLLWIAMDWIFYSEKNHIWDMRNAPPKICNVSEIFNVISFSIYFLQFWWVCSILRRFFICCQILWHLHWIKLYSINGSQFSGDRGD
jgi:hypothetical protein